VATLFRHSLSRLDPAWFGNGGGQTFGGATAQRSPDAKHAREIGAYAISYGSAICRSPRCGVWRVVLALAMTAKPSAGNFGNEFVQDGIERLVDIVVIAATIIILLVRTASAVESIEPLSRAATPIVIGIFVCPSVMFRFGLVRR
jgi:hypothetical protein